MIRIKIAVALLKWAGALVEYRVKRIKPKSSGSNVHADGTTLFRSKRLKEARAKFGRTATRTGETVAIQIVARIKEKHKSGFVEQGARADVQVQSGNDGKADDESA